MLVIKSSLNVCFFSYFLDLIINSKNGLNYFVFVSLKKGE